MPEVAVPLTIRDLTAEDLPSCPWLASAPYLASVTKGLGTRPAWRGGLSRGLLTIRAGPVCLDGGPRDLIERGEVGAGARSGGKRNVDIRAGRGARALHVCTCPLPRGCRSPWCVGDLLIQRRFQHILMNNFSSPSGRSAPGPAGGLTRAKVSMDIITRWFSYCNCRSGAAGPAEEVLPFQMRTTLGVGSLLAATRKWLWHK